ncbi:MAG: DUF1841 family protein [Alphaproteobacteria bacterium]|nr:DUF1841 family protein [Alphaproteobacteria bacterium]
MDYDPARAPTVADWLALDEQARIRAALLAHEGRFPDALHTAEANRMMHASLHAICETQIASGAPEITKQTLDRLCAAGIRRHAALHEIMRVLAHHIADMREGGRFDQLAWAADLAALGPSDVLGRALSGMPPSETATKNRAQRRAAKKRR